MEFTELFENTDHMDMIFWSISTRLLHKNNYYDIENDK